MERRLELNNRNTVMIRKAIKSDAEAMLTYIHTISSESDFLTFGKGEFDVTLEEEEAFIDRISKQDNALFIIATIEGKIVGNLSFIGGTRPRTAHVGEIGISVLKEYWGQGIGTELMEYLVQWCKESKIIRKINLRVRNDNHSAIRVYEKLGFKEEGLLTRDFCIEGEFYDSLCMGLCID